MNDSDSWAYEDSGPGHPETRQPRYTITQRPASLGGGWSLKLFDEDGEEMGGGVFPPDEAAESPEQSLLWAYNDADAEGSEWVQSRQG